MRKTCSARDTALAGCYTRYPPSLVIRSQCRHHGRASPPLQLDGILLPHLPLRAGPTRRPCPWQPRGLAPDNLRRQGEGWREGGTYAQGIDPHG